jgi:hypothetical protein
VIWVGSGLSVIEPSSRRAFPELVASGDYIGAWFAGSGWANMLTMRIFDGDANILAHKNQLGPNFGVFGTISPSKHTQSKLKYQNAPG